MSAEVKTTRIGFTSLKDGKKGTSATQLPDLFDGLRVFERGQVTWCFVEI